MMALLRRDVLGNIALRHRFSVQHCCSIVLVTNDDGLMEVVEVSECMVGMGVRDEVVYDNTYGIGQGR